ncbi:tyrosyl-tRNA synthetase [Schizopora paradoxa]|uniref:Tyrosine--tRNA ligase n=1 Tax=Schizopora paradoxa TaxID=27342 RepID=A0A0H2SQW2_9AGAM|nr:tyrosyl-tRNA synthetase [Schizopora paradoxa]
MFSRRIHLTVRRISRFYHARRDVTLELRERGMAWDMTNQLKSNGTQEKQTVYLGVDPTAKALHVGHLLPFMCLLHFHLHGHSVISLIGGATGLVGDPSGKLEERTPLGENIATQNVNSLRTAIQRFFSTASVYASRRIPKLENPSPEPQILNNVEWLGSLGLLEFLTKAGRYARVSTMINRDSVKLRMESQQGISFTEFTYQLLQAYDFYNLYHSKRCTMQIGGSDQWGNILAGIDLIDRTREPESPAPQALTTPLLTTASGAKFGKSEGNAVWLDSDLTSVFDFYQFFLRSTDADVEQYLKSFTLLSLEEVQSIVEKHKINPENRFAQKRLADEVTEMIHGAEAVKRAQIATQVLFSTDLANISAHEIVLALGDDPRLKVVSSEDVMDKPISKLAGTYRLVSSNSEANRLAASGGLYLNNKTVEPKQLLQRTDLLDGRVAVVRAGKDKHLILALR